MNTFDLKAREWDKDLKKVARAELFASKMAAFLNPQAGNTALEFGCGTGLVSFALKDYFATITLADTSQGMIEVAKEKAGLQQITHFNVLKINLLDDMADIPQVDVLYSMLTFHHLPSPAEGFKRLSGFIKNGGHLVIADLMPEDGSFHEPGDYGDLHLGFSREQIKGWMKQAGIEMLFYEELFKIEKAIDEHKREYPVFWAAGLKI